MRAAIALVLAAAALVAGRSASGAATWPNDPAWSQEWGPVLTHTNEVWQTAGTGSRPVIVAVVDTGVAEIPDLKGALVPGIDLVGTPPNGPLADHGTWVASIIAARGNNGRDAAGYCWTCLIMPVRVSDGGSPTSAATIAKGIVWAVDHGAQIVNVSLAGSEPSSDEQSAVAYAIAHHVIVVAAAGNSGATAPEYPADYPSVLSVSGTDQSDQLYPWSTRGSWVAVSAPGCTVVVDPNVGTAYGCGSSFAPAAVTGIAGLLLSLSSALTTDQVVAALRTTARPVAGIGGGRIDAAAALAVLHLPDAVRGSPSSQSTTATTATAATSTRQVTVVSGRLQKHRAIRMKTGSGPLVLQFISPAASTCQMQMKVGRGVVDSFTADKGVLSLTTRVAKGLHLLGISCSTRRPVQFTLQIESTLQTG
jgi:hypothetical protein